MASLASLLEQSQRLQSTLTQPGIDLPAINLNLDQIERQSRTIAGRSLKEQGLAGQGNASVYFCTTPALRDCASRQRQARP